MAIVFPPNPNPGDTFEAPNGVTYTWNGVAWVASGADTGSAYLPLDGGTMTGLVVLSGDPVDPRGAATKQYVDAHSGGGGGASVSIGPTPPAAPAVGDLWFEDEVTGRGYIFYGAPTGWLDFAPGAAGGGGLTVADANLLYLQLSGGTLTGPLTLSGAPSQDLHAATKAYADTKLTQAAADGRYLQLATNNVVNDARTVTWPFIAIRSGANLDTGSALYLGGTGTSIGDWAISYRGSGAGGDALVVQWQNNQALRFGSDRAATFIAGLTSNGFLRGASAANDAPAVGNAQGFAVRGDGRVEISRVNFADNTGSVLAVNRGGTAGAVQQWLISGAPFAQFRREGGENHFEALDGALVLRTSLAPGLAAFRCGANVISEVIRDATVAASANVVVNATTGVLSRSTSSASAKTDVASLDDPLSLVAALRPVFFRSRAEADGDRRFAGFIAEEVAAAFPEAAADDGQNYDVRAIVAALVGAVQSMGARLEALEGAA